MPRPCPAVRVFTREGQGKVGWMGQGRMVLNMGGAGQPILPNNNGTVLNFKNPSSNSLSVWTPSLYICKKFVEMFCF